ncbi:uncharacterized protein EI90DRAFT_3017421 [Cantharellus anzutake]|uniref:uncharacterized protein n=1 Tax=Cantharellus anzutake TaxID=1750568 RepID=UPI0019076CA7|nr:uncharacterized protein EI90DRAFT_3017421 [Cantharellus anzutake]KAF8328793.1 hypothetical protein EI90DRAFT_3017421 [Cantharellus anzutake]
MNVKELLNMDPSDEQWTKMWESLWDSNWNLDEKPPAFIVDQQIMDDIHSNLERPDSQAAPSTAEYSSFCLPPPGSATLVSGTNGIDPEDDSQVRNELSALDGLIRMSPELGVADDDEHVEPYLSTDSGSGPGDTLGPEMPVNPPDSEPETWPDETMDPTDNVETHAEPLTDLVPPSGFGDVDSPSCDKDIEERFWNENPRPQSLPPIRTIFDAIHSPTQSTQQQKPTKIWKEIMELHLPQETEKIVNNSKTRDKARYYKHIAIFPDALPTVNCQWLIHRAIIDAYVEMLKDLTDEKLQDILKTTHPHHTSTTKHPYQLPRSTSNWSTRVITVDGTAPMEQGETPNPFYSSVNTELAAYLENPKS